LPVGNLNGILMHDANNGYVVAPGGALFKTTDGGTSWVLDIAPTNSLFNTMAFAPKKVPASISMVNRKLFVTGANLSGAPLMEYGNPADIAVNAAETITNPTCTNPNGGSIVINATGGIAPYTYSIDGVTFQTSNTFNGLSQGAKTITVKDAYCGILIKNITVGFTDNLTLTTNNDTLACAGAPVQMLATSAATSYSWSPASGLSNPAISNPVARVNTNTVYTVTASLNGCVKTKTVTITVKPSPSVEAGNDKTIVAGDQVILEGSSSAATPVSIEWTPAASLSLANTFSPVARPNTTTVYTLTVKDNNNCTATDNVTVTVVPNCIKVMNAFTPNGDGVNERWLVTTGSSCATQIKAVVFNRYGNIVYENTNYQNNWDGTYKGKPVADGTYYYTVTYRLLNGRDVIMKGDITILR
ncbi:MAG: gliding motility-associated C-terminal domain-containing protein, partial [Flavihumibacter sp.]|nr:gliding motility-associated C-terminal domain-containing protein [Flavihumibacter sp.]